MVGVRRIPKRSSWSCSGCNVRMWLVLRERLGLTGGAAAGSGCAGSQAAPPQPLWIPQQCSSSIL